MYFMTARVSEVEKVSITTMYLGGDAKMWWRSHLSNNVSVNRDLINTWDVLTRDLKDQSLPSNDQWLARDTMKKLNKSSSVHDYVKEFSSLMLDIRDMSNEDKLFNFMMNLQPWAQSELCRLGVKNLPAAIATSECLVDFKVIDSK